MELKKRGTELEVTRYRQTPYTKQEQPTPKRGRLSSDHWCIKIGDFCYPTKS